MNLRIKDILKEKRISASELARRMGTTPQYINHLLKEKTNPSMDTYLRIAEALDVPLAALFTGYVESGTLVCPCCGARLRLTPVEEGGGGR